MSTGLPAGYKQRHHSCQSGGFYVSLSVTSRYSWQQPSIEGGIEAGKAHMEKSSYDNVCLAGR
jgi:hypothetical protein